MSPIRILLADDHVLMRRGIRALLERHANMEVIAEAGDGRAAVQLSEQHSPDVVVADIGMPILNGIEAARQITQKNQKTSIVILSMHSDESYVIRSLKAGARAYLLKDSAEADLISAIQAITEGKSYFSSAIRDLLKASLRYRPDRIIVGEVRDGAAYDLLEALNTGHAGSISTLHASSAAHARNRLARLALQADTGLPFSSIQSEIGDAIHYVGYIERRGSRRELTELIQITGFDSHGGTWELLPLSGIPTCE